MKNMPKPVPMRLAPGLNLNCDGAAVSLFASVCNAQTLAATLNKDGFAAKEALL